MGLLAAGSCVGIPRILSMAAAKRTTGAVDAQAAHVAHFNAAVYTIWPKRRRRPTVWLCGGIRGT